ncbi:MAG TPA: Hsp20/alpha crystallin family protein [Labilithrix sp.]|nr:Hsp20/alpha crystallin family protein [Labilithrix sp.]
MADIQVKRNIPQTAQVAPMRSPDPARWLSRMMGFDPFREMMPLLGEERLAFEPAFEVKETKDGYLFRADLPGVRLADLDVSVTDNRIQISGHREAEKEEKGDAFYTYERTYGSFTRAFTMPDGIDAGNIHADLRDGVLTVLVPKKAESMPKKIAIGTATPEAKKA